MQVICKLNSLMKPIERLLMALTVGGMTVLLIANVIFRAIGSSLSYAEELGGILMIACTYLGCPYCVRKCKHVRMSALIEKMPYKVGKYYSIVIDSITAFVFGFLAYNVGLYCISVYSMGSATLVLKIPRWVCILPVVIGLAFTCLQYILLILMNILDKDSFWIGTERRMGESDNE